MSEVAEVQDPGLRGGGGRKARPEAGTEFRGVCWRPGGKFAARIRESNGQSQAWLGTYDTAEHAARALDAAAVKMHGAAARTNFDQPAGIDDGGVFSLLHVPAEPAGGQDAGTPFRGVSRLPGGKFGARITDSKEKSQKWFGTFDTADEAARAFDTAAVKIRGAEARTNFKQPVAIDDGGVSSLVHVPAEPSGHDVPTKFRGVCRQPGGKFGAKISNGKSQTWLGTFDTARAFDAAAVKIRGPATRTNFKQPAAVDDGGVSSLVHCKSIAQICGRKGKAALSLGGFHSPGMRHDDLPVDLPPTKWQQVDEMLKDMYSTDDRKELMEGAAVLQYISLADMMIKAPPWQNGDVDDEHSLLVG